MKKAIKNHKDLLVWQKAMKLVKMIYQLTKQFPQEEIYCLTTQMRRAAISIPSNIAEGQARKSTKEFINYLSIAQGSRAELETQVLIAIELEYMEKTDAAITLEQLLEIKKMLHGLVSSLK